MLVIHQSFSCYSALLHRDISAPQLPRLSCQQGSPGRTEPGQLTQTGQREISYHKSTKLRGIIQGAATAQGLAGHQLAGVCITHFVNSDRDKKRDHHRYYFSLPFLP